MLCEYCTSMFQGEMAGDHHPNLKSLQEAVAQGCPICTQVFWGSNSPVEERAALKWGYWHWRQPEDDAQVPVTIVVDGRSDQSYDEEHSFVLFPSSSESTKSSIADRNGQLPMPGSLHTTQEWMRLCSKTHELCGDLDQHGSYPTRLLEIGATGVQLILTEEKEPTGTYASLSYCWGPPPYEFPRLTTSNIDDMLQSELPMARLPVAFREAIGFTWNLGIRYVWIDCLCIIQDGARSDEDWAFESSRMALVYTNCGLCLSLDQAKTPEESIFHWSTPTTFMLPFEINTTGIFGLDDSPRKGTRCTVFASDYLYDALYGQPLGSRAWALQERILPRRVLGFGQGEVFWSCRQLPHACESFPSGISSFTAQRLHVRPSSLQITPDLNATYVDWFKFQSEYSRRILTFPEKDKLAAFSAVASLMETATNDSYIAGHFWKTIPHSLLWRAGKKFGFEESLKLRESLRIPSWSWASAPGWVTNTYSEIFYKGAETLVAHAERYFEPSKDILDVKGLPSVLLELSVYRIKGTISFATEDHDTRIFYGEQPTALASCADDWLVHLDYDIAEDIEVVFCPISCSSPNIYSRKHHGWYFVSGVFQMETDGEVSGRKVYERVGFGNIRIKPEPSWHELVSELGMERSSILLG